MTAAPGSVVLASCMRNEGLFIVEWLAYHSLLGFSDILIFTNNCTDGSDLLLDRLQVLGWVTHIRHSPPPGVAPQIAAMGLAFRHPAVIRAEWMLHIDADEFLNVTAGDGSVQALLQATGEADVIAIAWNLFGSAGLTRWDGGAVLASFTRGQGAPMRRTIDHKSLFRPSRFTSAIDHMPKTPKAPPAVAKNTQGVVISAESLDHPKRSRFKVPFGHVTFANASIHHYAVKSLDVFLMKNDRGDGMGLTHAKYRIGSQFHSRYDRNEVEDRSILCRWPAVEARMAEMLADPEVRRLNDACLGAFRARRDVVLTPDRIAAWTAPPESPDHDPAGLDPD